ncbi:MAG TPA: penicillin acylase family protein, partial [Bacteroidia bacterium]|nr:penicillin acylase family protein [Bacteroidia bacterium]
QGNQFKEKSVQVLHTLHGPVMANRNGQLISLRSYNRSMTSLIQSWKRTKAKNFEEYKATMSLLGNTSNNTVYADDKGNIAYWHGNFVPVRDVKYDWSKPVDGTTQATSWKGSHTTDQTIHVYNPSSGWIQNCNSTPFTCSGNSSPKKTDYPTYMAPDGENFRGINAAKLFSQQKKYTMDDAIKLGYNSYMSAFELLIPALLNDFKKISRTDSIYNSLKEPIQLLEHWDYYSNENSIPTTIAIEWGERLLPLIAQTKITDPYSLNTVEKMQVFLAAVPKQELCAAMFTTITDLQKRFGTWKIAWGEINRYQRLSGDIDLKYDDTKKSLPAGFTSSAWGTLPSFVSNKGEGTNKRYGNRGNSFICIVEFGEKIKAKSLLTGGQSSSPTSSHFNDQAELFCKGSFKDVLFYKEDILKHMEKSYHPGE